MTTITLTEFQRNFRQARKKADNGLTVFIKGDGVTYAFDKYVPAQNPFAGLEHILGKPKPFPPIKANGHPTKKRDH